MGKKISLADREEISIYLGKSIPADELYFTCEDKKKGNEIDLTVIDPYGIKDSGRIVFSDKKDMQPRPLGIKPKGIRRFRLLKLSTKQDMLEMEMKFYWSHAPGNFEPLQFSIIEWE